MMAEGDLGEGGWSLEPICNARDAAASMGTVGGDAIEQLCRARHLFVLLMEASALMGLHCNAIRDSIIPATLKQFSEESYSLTPQPSIQSPPIAYLLMTYSDYYASTPTVKTLYFGHDHEALLEACRDDSIYCNGSPIFNALHEGLAAVLDNISMISSLKKRHSAMHESALWLSQRLFVIHGGIICEGGEPFPPTRPPPLSRLALGQYNGKTVDMLVGLLREKGVAVNMAARVPPKIVAAASRKYWQEARRGAADGGPAHTLEGSAALQGPPQTWHPAPPTVVAAMALPPGWALWGTTRASKDHPARSSDALQEAIPAPLGMHRERSGTASSQSPATMASPDDGASGGDARRTSPEDAARAFLAQLLRMSPALRSGAIKKHLESPAYSSEYKHCLVSLVKQMQTQPQGGPLPAATPNGSGPLPATSGVITAANMFGSRSSTPIWRGRIAFKNEREYIFDVAAFPCANPRHYTDVNYVPLPAEYHLESWPEVMGISSYIPVQSPAVAKSVPFSRLVELVPLTFGEGHQFAGNPNSAGIALLFRNLLSTKQTAGLVRLASAHAMLIASRPNQLVGLLISRSMAIPQSVTNEPSRGAAEGNRGGPPTALSPSKRRRSIGPRRGSQSLEGHQSSGDPAIRETSPMHGGPVRSATAAPFSFDALPHLREGGEQRKQSTTLTPDAILRQQRGEPPPGQHHDEGPAGGSQGDGRRMMPSAGDGIEGPPVGHHGAIVGGQRSSVPLRTPSSKAEGATIAGDEDGAAAASAELFNALINDPIMEDGMEGSLDRPQHQGEGALIDFTEYSYPTLNDEWNGLFEGDK